MRPLLLPLLLSFSLFRIPPALQGMKYWSFPLCDPSSCQIPKHVSLCGVRTFVTISENSGLCKKTISKHAKQLDPCCSGRQSMALFPRIEDMTRRKKEEGFPSSHQRLHPAHSLMHMLRLVLIPGEHGLEMLCPGMPKRGQVDMHEEEGREEDGQEQMHHVHHFQPAGN